MSGQVVQVILMLSLCVLSKRHFWWFKNVLWIEDVTHPCHVFLCAADEVSPHCPSHSPSLS
jgi:hypothetical protein